MVSHTISKQLKPALERTNMEQKALSTLIFKSQTTVNGYVQGGDKAPVAVMADIAEAVQDDLLNQDFAHQVFNQIPSMNSEVFEESALSLYILHRQEVAERDHFRQDALLAMAKHKSQLSKGDKEALWNYAMNKLDVIFIELRHVIKLFEMIDLSLGKAINLRKPHWRVKQYMRGE